MIGDSYLPVYIVAKIIVTAVHYETTHRHTEWEEHLSSRCLPHLQQNTPLQHFALPRILQCTMQPNCHTIGYHFSYLELLRWSFADKRKANYYLIFGPISLLPSSYRRSFTGCKGLQVDCWCKSGVIVKHCSANALTVQCLSRGAKLCLYLIFLFHGKTVPRGPGPPHYRSITMTHHTQ